MQRIAWLCFAATTLTCFTGCPSLVHLTNNGPNPVTITGTPSAVDPDFPLVIPVGETATIDYLAGPVNIQAVDMTTFNADTLENVDIDQGALSFIAIEWTGDELINHGLEP